MRGDTILGSDIKSDTMIEYCIAAADLYTKRGLDNPFQPKHEELEENIPEMLCSGLKKYEAMPDRKECITDSMFAHINDLSKESESDSLISALKDWICWGRYGGQRRQEWCQKTKSKFSTIPEGEGPAGEALAFRADDILFFDKSGRLLDIGRVKFKRAYSASVCWRYQKNKNNGEKISYYRDDSSPDWCAVRALWNISQRAFRFGIPSNEPIAKYREKNGSISFITDYHVKALLQKSAREALNIKDEKVLNKWTSHSIRVTAANELHRMNFSEAFIKKRLRWKSEAFLVYLRNTVHNAAAHTARLAKSAIKITDQERKDIPCIYSAPNRDNNLWEHRIALAQ